MAECFPRALCQCCADNRRLAAHLRRSASPENCPAGRSTLAARIENPRVGGSIPSSATIFKGSQQCGPFFFGVARILQAFRDPHPGCYIGLTTSTWTSKAHLTCARLLSEAHANRELPRGCADVEVRQNDLEGVQVLSRIEGPRDFVRLPSRPKVDRRSFELFGLGHRQHHASDLRRYVGHVQL